MSLYKPVTTPKFIGAKSEPWEMDGRTGVSGSMQVLLDGAVDVYKYDVGKFDGEFSGFKELDLLDVVVDVRTYQGRSKLHLVECSKVGSDRAPVKG